MTVNAAVRCGIAHAGAIADVVFEADTGGVGHVLSAQGYLLPVLEGVFGNLVGLRTVVVGHQLGRAAVFPELAGVVEGDRPPVVVVHGYAGSEGRRQFVGIVQAQGVGTCRGTAVELLIDEACLLVNLVSQSGRKSERGRRFLAEALGVLYAEIQGVRVDFAVVVAPQ